MAEASLDDAATQALDRFLVRVRTAQNGIAAGGPNGVKRIQKLSQLETQLDGRVAAARAKLAAIDAEPVPTKAAGRERITVTHDTPQWQQWREAQRIDRRAEEARQARRTAAQNDLRDAEEALTNLRGRGAANGLGDQNTATAATAAAVQSAKDALTILAFQGRLPDAVAEWRALPEATPLGAAFGVAPRRSGALARAADAPQGPVRPQPQGRPIRLGTPAPDELPTGERLALPPGRPQPGRTIPLGAAGPMPSWAGPIELGPGPALANPQRDVIRAYLDHQKQLYLRDQLAAKASGKALADHILHNYERVYDYDFLLRWLAPWELWTSRTLAKLPLRMADHPAYYSKVGILRETMRDANADLPEWLQAKVQVPAPFAPEFMGDQLFFDPVKLFLPTDMLDTFVRDEELETKQGRARAAAGFLGINPGPIADLMLALAPGGQNWWETQSRSPLADLWTAASAAANKVGIPMPVRPVATQADRNEARRQLFMMFDGGEIDRAEWEAATKDLEENFTAGAALSGVPLQNEIAWRALQRAQGRSASRSILSLFGVLGADFSREELDEAGRLSGEYGRIREEQGKDAAAKFLDEHPTLSAFWGLSDPPSKRLDALATNRYYEGLRSVGDEYRKAVAGLPLFGTDKDRQQLQEERGRKERELVAQLQEEFPAWRQPAQTRTLPDHLAQVIRDLPLPRDSNGVADWDAFFAQREESLKSLERAPVTQDDQILTEFAPQNLRPDVEAVLRPKTVDTAVKDVIETIVSEGWEGRAQAGAAAATREAKARLEATYEQNWHLPDRQALVDRTVAEFPDLFGPGGRFTAADIF
ncbi:MAG: hypothetical protein ACRDJ9_15320, partial [Dehalococcoidia bacterium]